jgi:hypothetical protein
VATKFSRRTHAHCFAGSKGKGKKEADAEKKAAAAAKKAEAAALLAQEEKDLAANKPVKAAKPVKGADKAAAKKTEKAEAYSQRAASVEEFAASNLDDALDMLSVATASSQSAQQQQLDRHPERRAKAA